MLAWLERNGGTIKAAAIAVGGLVAAFVAFKVAATAASVAVAAFGVAVAILTSPITLTVLAVAGLAAGFYVLYQRSAAFRNFIHGELLPTLSAIGEFAQRVGTVAVAAFGGFVAWVRSHWSKIGPLLTGPFNLIRNAVEGALDIVATTFRVFLAVLRGDWGLAWDLLVGVVKRTGERSGEGDQGKLEAAEGCHRSDVRSRQVHAGQARRDRRVLRGRWHARGQGILDEPEGWWLQGDRWVPRRRGTRCC